MGIIFFGGRPEAGRRPLPFAGALVKALAGALAGVFFSGTVLAQTPRPAPAGAGRTGTATAGTGNAQARYERGKNLLMQEKYGPAVTELQPLTRLATTPPGPYTNAATYLWALAALRAGRAREAEPVLARLRAQQPQWAGQPDVVLLQAQVAEALGDRARARDLLLRDLPAGQLTTEKTTLLARLGYGPAGQPAAPRPYVQVGPLRVSVLLPLSLDDAEGARRTLFAQELYAGLRLAADSLTAQGQAVELRVFDLGNDTVAAKILVQDGTVLAADLIVGPIYKAPARLIGRAAAARQVPVLNPLSEDGALLAEAATLYLFRPSAQTQARAAARLAYSRFEPKNAVLLAEETYDDAAFAAAFRAEYEQLGGTVKAEEKISSQTYRTRMTEKVAALPLDSAALPGVLVVASKERNAVQQVVSRLERNDLKLPVVAPATWLELPEMSLDQFSDREFYFLAPTWRPTGTPADKRLRQAWNHTYHVPPTDFGRTGFELLYVFAPLVRQYGPADLSAGLNQTGPQPGPLLPTIGYPGGARDNQPVSILKLTNRQLEEVK